MLVGCMFVTVAQLRHFVKSCKVPAYTRKMKELIGKIMETSTAVTERRQAATLNLQDLSAVVRNWLWYCYFIVDFTFIVSVSFMHIYRFKTTEVFHLFFDVIQLWLWLTKWHLCAGVVGVKVPWSWHSVEQILHHVEKAEGSTAAGWGLLDVVLLLLWFCGILMILYHAVIQISLASCGCLPHSAYSTKSETLSFLF